jgi:hypothetical protein
MQLAQVPPNPLIGLGVLELEAPLLGDGGQRYLGVHALEDFGLGFRIYPVRELGETLVRPTPERNPGQPPTATCRLRFTNPSPPSGWVEDFHLRAIEHARHTTNPLSREGVARQGLCGLAE